MVRIQESDPQTKSGINNLFIALESVRNRVPPEEFHKFIGKNEVSLFPFLHPFGFNGSHVKPEGTVKDFDRAFSSWERKANVIYSSNRWEPPSPSSAPSDAYYRQRMYETAAGDPIAAAVIVSGALIGSTIGKLFGFEQDPKRAAAAGEGISHLATAGGSLNAPHPVDEMVRAETEKQQAERASRVRLQGSKDPTREEGRALDRGIDNRLLNRDTGARLDHDVVIRLPEYEGPPRFVPPSVKKEGISARRTRASSQISKPLPPSKANAPPTLTFDELLASAERPTPRQQVGGFRSQSSVRSGNKEVIIIEGTVGEPIPPEESMAKYGSRLKGEHATHGVGLQLHENLPEGLTSTTVPFNTSKMKKVENLMRKIYDSAKEVGARVETRTDLYIEHVKIGKEEIPVCVGVNRKAWVVLPGSDETYPFVEFSARLDPVTRKVKAERIWIRPSMPQKK